MNSEDIDTNSQDRDLSRRSFMKSAGLVGAGAAVLAGSGIGAAAISGCTPAEDTKQPATSDKNKIPEYESDTKVNYPIPPNEDAKNTVYTDDGKGYLYEKDGWYFLHLEGAAKERGLQYGTLLGSMIEDTIARQKRYFAEVNAYDWDYFKTHAKTMWESNIDAEWIEEMSGIVEGSALQGAGFDLWDLIVWNANSELTDYWFPKVSSDYYKDKPAGVVEAGTPAAWEHKNHCSAFIATGSYTADGDIIVAHNTWQTYENGRYANLVIDIVPESGEHFIMQSKPGYIHSQADYYETESLIIAETTIGSFKAYSQTGIPEFIRIRNAAQYAKTNDEFVTIMKEGNTGGYANTWLVGELDTGEIMRFELGLKFYNAVKTKDGFYAGANVALDPRIRTYETGDALAFADIRSPGGARMVRIPQLIEENKGKLDLEIAKEILSDHYDPYLKADDHPGVRSICSHYDKDPQEYLASRLPYRPQGAVDGKVGSTATARAFTIEGRFGKTCGMPWSVDEHLNAHPQFEFLREFLVDFPSYPWTSLTAL